jgi:formylglycine-generating enzyme required for sulfatase activity
VLFGGEGTPTTLRAPETVEAAREWAAVDKSSIVELETFVRRHPTSTEAEYAKARIESVSRQIASAEKPSEPAKPGLVPGLLKETIGVVLPKEQPAVCNGVEALVSNKKRCLKPKDSFTDCSDCPEMVVVAAGTFAMGSPTTEPERTGREDHVWVSIPLPFAVGKYAMTFDEWDACVADGGCNNYKPSDEGWGRGKRPIINVNWEDANIYAGWLSRKSGRTYHLLSDAEREYVARAGTKTPFWWGASITPEQANYDGNYTYRGGGSKGEYRRLTLPVDSFDPNPWGLYNVHGNVWEWTEDCFNDINMPGDGRARTTGDCSKRVIRGGSWHSGPQFLRSATRNWGNAVDRSNIVGFRLSRTLP